MNVDRFSRQVAAMSDRLSTLLTSANFETSQLPETSQSQNFSSDVFKELGVATEELQVATEELHQQNEELIRALDEIALERRRYQDLFQSAPQAYFITSIDGQIQDANRMASQLLGVPLQFLVGKPLLPFVNEADRSLYWAELRQRQQRDHFLEWECSFKPRTGELVDVACSVVAIRDQEDQPVGFRWIVRDITEQKRLTRLEQNGNGIHSHSDTALLDSRPIRKYSQGELIPLSSQVLWYVVQGTVKLTSITDQNKEVLLAFVSSGMPFGTYLTVLPIYQATALSDVQLVSISLTEITTSPYLSQLLFARTSQRLRQTELFISILGEPNTEMRLCRLLQLLEAEIGQPVEQGVRLGMRLTHEDLASACCSTRVTITRLLGKLQRQGKIMIDDDRHIVLTAPEQLAS